MFVWIKTAIQLLKFIDKMLLTSDLIIFTSSRSRCCNCLVPKPFFSSFQLPYHCWKFANLWNSLLWSQGKKKKEYFIFNLMKSSDFMLTYLILARGVGESWCLIGWNLFDVWDAECDRRWSESLSVRTPA